MKVQLCKFQRTEYAEKEVGIAYVQGFDGGQADLILDSEGKTVRNPWSYVFLRTPLPYIDSEYK